MASQNIDIIIQAKDLASKAIGNAQKSLKNLKIDTEQVKNAWSNLTTSSAVAFGAVSVGIASVTKSSNEARASMIGLQSIVEGTGNDFSLAQKKIEEYVADGLVSTGDASTALKNLLARGFGLEESIELMNRFKDSAAFGRQSSLGLGEAIRSASEGLKNENSILVDNAGVTKNVSVMWDEYAQTLGKTANELTIAEKRQAEFNGIIQETRFQTGDAAKLAGEFAGTQARLGAETTKLKIAVGEALTPALNTLYQTILPIVQKATEWIKNNQELATKITIVVVTVTGLITVLGGLGLALSAITSAFVLVKAGAIALGVALQFLALNPIGMVITAIAAGIAIGILIVKNWETIKDSAKKLGAVITNTFSNIKESVTSAFSNMVQSAKEWGGNMIQMFVDGIKAKVQALKDGITQIATTISDYLGFHSPTKKGPASDSDKWMPNMIKMFEKGIYDGVPKIKLAALSIANTLGRNYGEFINIDTIAEKLESIKTVMLGAFSSVNGQIQDTKGNIESLGNEIKGLEDRLKSLKDQRKNLESETGGKLAERAIEIEKKLLDEEIDSIEKKKLQQELALATEKAGIDAINEARAWSAMSETERIIATAEKKKADIEIEMQGIRNLLAQKYEALDAEKVKLTELQDLKVNFENQYHKLFMEHAEARQISIQKAITAMQKLNSMSGASNSSVTGARASGGDVTQNRSYVVGENGPEIFTPRTSGSITKNSEIGSGGITINMGGVTVQNSADEDRLVQKLTRMIELQRLGIS